ncbi:hypothetical protein [Marilutibacter alkalisoli]|uniref:Uncharacterized protein n=1 Tax=Marilutibacter alkalisoli TaxID=2591633 RepID=A0A514BVW3_9GAMM|nr:hypothetical protein [Lysobacter alkalisoli]QDH71510.1 hypothetical protein FKV23_16480 [Lysobacter alkalisoli]
MLLLLPACGGSHDAAPERSTPAAEAQDAVALDEAGNGGTVDAAAAPAEDDASVRAGIESILGGNADDYKSAFLALQKAVAAGDKDAVAQMILYPLNGAVDGQQTIRDAGQFVREYDSIVTPAIADAVARQNFADLMVNKNGLMFGNGEVWLTGICEDDACEKQSILVTTLQDTSDLDN